MKLRKVRHDRKDLISVFAYFLSACAKSLFLEQRDFANKTLHCKILSLRLFGTSLENWYIRFLILDTKFHFTYGEWNLRWNFVKFQIGMQRIAKNFFLQITFLKMIVSYFNIVLLRLNYQENCLQRKLEDF